jgi:hypothetical protein
MSEFYDAYTDDEVAVATEPRVEFMESETNYYGIPMRFSKVKETQFKSIMLNIGDNPVIIDFNLAKGIKIQMDSTYGDTKQNLVSNYPNTTFGYYLTETYVSDISSKLNSDLVEKYTKNKTKVWIPTMSGFKAECNWFIDPTDWSVRTFGSGNVVGKVTNLEAF